MESVRRKAVLQFSDQLPRGRCLDRIGTRRVTMVQILGVQRNTLQLSLDVSTGHMVRELHGRREPGRSIVLLREIARADNPMRIISPVRQIDPRIGNRVDLTENRSGPMERKRLQILFESFNGNALDQAGNPPDISGIDHDVVAIVSNPPFSVPVFYLVDGRSIPDIQASRERIGQELGTALTGIPE